MPSILRAKIALVDDHPVFREGLAATLAAERDLEIVGQANGAPEAMTLAARGSLDLLVIDILMPMMSGISLAGEMYERYPACKVLALSVIDDPGLIADMLRARAAGYAIKTQPAHEIVDAIRQVLGGIRYLPPAVSRAAIEAAFAGPPAGPRDRLTPREREVFELLLRGRSNAEIAATLVIARRTVETHRQRITKKLSARSLPQLQRIAARHGGLTV